MSWLEKSIGQICEVIAGQSPKGEFYNDNGNGLPFYQGKKDFGKKYIGAPQKWTTHVTKEAESGDVLMSVRAPVGPVNFAVEKVCIGRGLAAIRAKGDVDRNFLFYGLLAKQSEISGNQGAVFSSINKKQIESIPFLLPPLPEQKRIVAILDKAFEGIDTAIANTEKNLANARELFESYLNNVFSDEREGWESEELSMLVSKDCSLSYGIVQPGDDYLGGMPIVRPTDLGPTVIRREGLKLIDPSKADSYQRTKLKGNELLLCVRGSTGAIAFADKELEGANVTRGIVPIRFDPEKVRQEFGYFAFISKPVKDQIAAGTYGAALMQINIRDLKKVIINFPSTKEQDSLLKNLKEVQSNCENLIHGYRQKLTALSELKQSILNKAFSGELTTIKDDELRTEEVA